MVMDKPTIQVHKNADGEYEVIKYQCQRSFEEVIFKSTDEKEATARCVEAIASLDKESVIRAAIYHYENGTKCYKVGDKWIPERFVKNLFEVDHWYIDDALGAMVFHNGRLEVFEGADGFAKPDRSGFVEE